MIEKLKQINFPTSATFDNKKVAVSITCFNRPDLLKQVIENINNCDELEDIPIFLYCDGGSYSKQAEAIEEFKKIKFKNKYLIKRSLNYGCEKNTIFCIDDILSELRFDYLFLIEDDILVGKRYFKICFDKFNQINATIDSNIGIFQGYNNCFMSLKEKKVNKDLIEITESDHHWGFLISRDCYLSIKNILEPYYSIVYSSPIGDNANRAFMANKVNINNAFDEIINKYSNKITNFTKNRYYKKQNVHCTLGWDGAFELGMSCSPYKRYKSVINYCTNIGNYGTHFNDAIFKHLKLDKITLDEVW